MKGSEPKAGAIIPLSVEQVRGECRRVSFWTKADEVSSGMRSNSLVRSIFAFLRPVSGRLQPPSRAVYLPRLFLVDKLALEGIRVRIEHLMDNAELLEYRISYCCVRCS